MREGPEKRSGSRRLRRGLTGFECPKIQSDLMQEIQFGCGEGNSPANICNLPMTCLKNLCTFALRVCGHTAFPEQTPLVGVCLGSFRGAVPCPAMLSDTLRLSFYRPAPFLLTSGRNVQILKKSFLLIAPLGAVFKSLCLVHETAHPNIHHNTQRQKHEQN